MAVKKINKSSEITSMAELLATYSDKKPVNLGGLKKGQRVLGIVIEKTPKTLILDIGGKSEGVIAEKAYQEAREFIKNLNVGDEIAADVLVPETTDGFTILSLRQSSQDSSWNSLEKALKDQDTLTANVVAVNSAGLTVSILGVMGFVPTSHLGKELVKNQNDIANKNIQVQIIELDRKSNRVVLSEKNVSDAGDIKAQKAVLDKLKEGNVYDAEVTAVTDFGAFAKVVPDKRSAGVEGLVHISELAWQRTEKPSDVIKVGDKIKVRVLGLRDGKLSLSIKQAQDDPWEKEAKKYKKDDNISGKITRTSDFGVFVELTHGVEGLIHMTKIAPGQKYEVGSSVNATIEEIDLKAKKISLSPILTAKPIGYK